MLLVIKIFLCVENLIRKEHEVVFLEEEIFQSGNELLWKKKKRKKRSSSRITLLSHLSLYPLAQKYQRYISNEIGFPLSPSNLEFHRLPAIFNQSTRTIHGFYIQIRSNKRSNSRRAFPSILASEDTNIIDSSNIVAIQGWTHYISPFSSSLRVPILSLMEYLRCSTVMEPFHRSFHFFFFLSFFLFSFYFFLFPLSFFLFPSERATRVRVNRNGGRELQGERAVN